MPLALIVLQSVSLLPEKPLGAGFVAQFVQFAGQPVVALLVGVGIAMLLPKKLDRRALAVVAIGAGAMVVSHVNDSYFWGVTRFSHMSLAQGYRLQTLGTLVEGCVAAAAVWVLSLIVL